MLAACLLLSSLSAVAADQPAAAGGAAAASNVISNPLFRQKLWLSGELGQRHVEMLLQPKSVEEDGLEGSYQIAGRTGRPAILLAGEVSADRLSMEESDDGKDVSGEWNGDINGMQVSGTWLSADGMRSERFLLHISQTPVPLAQASAKR